MPSCWKSKSVLAVERLGLQVLMCYFGAAGTVKILRVLLKQCQLFSEKLVCELLDSRSLCLRSLTWVYSLAQGART